VDKATLAAGLSTIEAAPTDRGVLELIVRRPETLARESVDAAELSLDVGLVGDNWLARGSRHTDDGSAEPERQLTLMNARAIDLFAGGDKARWPEAGDQLYIDLSLAETNVPAGTRLAIGDAVVEVSPLPHTGCAKFLERFGRDVSQFVTTGDGMRLHLRGINAFVVTPGTISTGDAVVKL
jgi:MOSC domain-containing protein YiiM